MFTPFHTIDDLEFKLCHPRVPLEKSIWPRLVHRFTTVGTFEERLAHIIAEKWLGSASLDDHDMCGNFYYQNSKNSLSRCCYVFYVFFLWLLDLMFLFPFLHSQLTLFKRYSTCSRVCFTWRLFLQYEGLAEWWIRKTIQWLRSYARLETIPARKVLADLTISETSGNLLCIWEIFFRVGDLLPTTRGDLDIGYQRMVVFCSC